MAKIDHLVYTADTLNAGMDEIESKLGVRPALGGSHPDFGTHNAVLSLGPSCYIEVIAPDPNLKAPDRGLPFGMGTSSTSHIATWALRCERIENQVTVAKRDGLDLGLVESGNRRKQDGDMLSWKLTNPYALLFDGAVPFLISWGKTSHPSSMIPQGGELSGFRIEHPYPEQVEYALNILDVKVPVQRASRMRMIATIMTSNGLVALF